MGLYNPTCFFLTSEHVICNAYHALCAERKPILASAASSSTTTDHTSGGRIDRQGQRAPSKPLLIRHEMLSIKQLYTAFRSLLYVLPQQRHRATMAIAKRKVHSHERMRVYNRGLRRCGHKDGFFAPPTLPGAEAAVKSITVTQSPRLWGS